MLTYINNKCTHYTIQTNKAAVLTLTNSKGLQGIALIIENINSGFKCFPFNGFTYFSLSFQSAFHLSLTVLVRYRSCAHI